jgi:hypothetical protein
MSEPSMAERAEQHLARALEQAGIAVPREMFERMVRSYTVLRADLDTLYTEDRADESQGKEP